MRFIRSGWTRHDLRGNGVLLQKEKETEMTEETKTVDSTSDARKATMTIFERLCNFIVWKVKVKYLVPIRWYNRWAWQNCSAGKKAARDHA